MTLISAPDEPRLVPDGHRTMTPDGWIALLASADTAREFGSNLVFLCGDTEVPARVDRLTAVSGRVLLLVGPSRALEAGSVCRLARSDRASALASGILVVESGSRPVEWTAPPRLVRLIDVGDSRVAAVIAIPSTAGAGFVLVREVPEGRRGAPPLHGLFELRDGQIRVDWHPEFGGLFLSRSDAKQFEFFLLDRGARRVPAPGDPVRLGP